MASSYLAALGVVIVLVSSAAARPAYYGHEDTGMQVDSLPFKTCGTGAWDVFALELEPYPMVKGANVTVRLPTLTDAAVQNATSPAGYSMHIRISWENFIEVYDSRKALCSFVSDCPLIEGNVTLVHTQTVPNYALGGSYRMKLDAYRDDELLFCGYSDLKVTGKKGADIRSPRNTAAFLELMPYLRRWDVPEDAMHEANKIVPT